MCITLSILGGTQRVPAAQWWHLCPPGSTISPKAALWGLKDLSGVGTDSAGATSGVCSAHQDVPLTRREKGRMLSVIISVGRFDSSCGSSREFCLAGTWREHSHPKVSTCCVQIGKLGRVWVSLSRIYCRMQEILFSPKFDLFYLELRRGR